MPSGGDRAAPHPHSSTCCGRRRLAWKVKGDSLSGFPSVARATVVQRCDNRRCYNAVPTLEPPPAYTQGTRCHMTLHREGGISSRLTRLLEEFQHSKFNIYHFLS